MRHALLLCFALSLPAHAAFEVRAHYGALQGKPNGFNTQAEDFVTGAPDVKPPTALGGDVLLALPIIPLAFGVRYETFTTKSSGPATKSGTAVTTVSELNATRTAVLAGYRVLSLPIAYLGLLAQYGLSQNLKQTLKSTNAGGSTATNTFDFKSQASYGLGLEGGARVGYLTLGAEVGYTIFKGKDARDGLGVVLDKSFKPVDIDLSGTYFKVMVGARF